MSRLFLLVFRSFQHVDLKAILVEIILLSNVNPRCIQILEIVFFFGIACCISGLNFFRFFVDIHFNLITLFCVGIVQ